MNARVMALLLLVACESEPRIAPPRDLPVAPSRPDAEVPEVAEVSYAVSSGKSVLWKRYAAFERDLMRALSLEQAEVCRELGDKSCIRDVHLIALGGNDPFGSGIHRPPPGTLATTPIVVDRVLLSACSAAAKKRTLGDLDGPAPQADAPIVRETITKLYRRLLARDPKPEELTRVAALLEPGEGAPQSAQEFAVLACFVVGSSLEFLFQ